MLCSDHQGDTDNSSNSGGTSCSDDEDDASSNSSESELDYDFDNVNDEDEEEMDSENENSPPPSDQSDSDNSSTSSSSSSTVSSPSTYRNANLDDAEAVELRRWYKKSGSQLKHIAVHLCTTSQSFLKKLEYAKKILDKKKKKNPKYSDCWAANKAGISPSLFCQYLKKFRNSRPQQPFRPWLGEQIVKRLKSLIEDNDGKEGKGMRKKIAKELNLHPGNVSRILHSKGMVLQKQNRNGDTSHYEEGVRLLNEMIDKNKGNEKKGMRAKVCKSLKLDPGNFSTYLHSKGMVLQHQHRNGDKSHFDEGVRLLKKMIDKNKGHEKKGMRAAVAKKLGLHCGHFSTHLRTIGMKFNK